MEKTLFEKLDEKDDGQEDCEPVHLKLTAGEVRYLRALVETEGA